VIYANPKYYINFNSLDFALKSILESYLVVPISKNANRHNCKKIKNTMPISSPENYAQHGRKKGISNSSLKE
tara:strand:+ start:760 stop:975 length:216 start_codon:yes stop_codon:yes gene_type:complete